LDLGALDESPVPFYWGKTDIFLWEAKRPAFFLWCHGVNARSYSHSCEKVANLISSFLFPNPLKYGMVAPD
jgi:hypothetical protein